MGFPRGRDPRIVGLHCPVWGLMLHGLPHDRGFDSGLRIIARCELCGGILKVKIENNQMIRGDRLRILPNRSVPNACHRYAHVSALRLNCFAANDDHGTCSVRSGQFWIDTPHAIDKP